MTFDPFWGTYTAVDKICHSDMPHMPVAICLHQVQNTVLERLQKKYDGDESKMQAPSLEWLRLRFWPQNAYSSSALRHTERVSLKFGVQVHQLHHCHTDVMIQLVSLVYLCP